MAADAPSSPLNLESQPPASIDLPPLPVRPPLEMRTDWQARMQSAPTLYFGVGLPDMPAPACIVNGQDPAGAEWIAYRLNRAAMLENSLTTLLTSTAALLAAHGADVGVSAQQLFEKTYNLLALTDALQRSESGGGVTREGEG